MITTEEALKVLDADLRHAELCLEMLAAASDGMEKCVRYEVNQSHREVQENVDTYRMAIDALREKAERENPKPLTIEELRQMDGEPVWVSDLKYPSDSGYCVIRASKDLFSEYGDRYYLASIPGNEGGWYAFEKYSEEWIAYRHKPKEEV